MEHGFILFINKCYGKPRAHLGADKTGRAPIRLKQFRIAVITHEKYALRTDLGTYLTLYAPGTVYFYGALGNFPSVFYLIIIAVLGYHWLSLHCSARSLETFQHLMHIPEQTHPVIRSRNQD